MERAKAFEKFTEEHGLLVNPNNTKTVRKCIAKVLEASALKPAQRRSTSVCPRSCLYCSGVADVYRILFRGVTFPG